MSDEWRKELSHPTEWHQEVLDAISVLHAWCVQKIEEDDRSRLCENGSTIPSGPQ